MKWKHVGETDREWHDFKKDKDTPDPARFSSLKAAQDFISGCESDDNGCYAYHIF